MNFYKFFFFVYITDLLFILGLVRSRDGSRLSPNTQAYMSLPSPNIQSAKVSAAMILTAISVLITKNVLTAISILTSICVLTVTNVLTAITSLVF